MDGTIRIRTVAVSAASVVVAVLCTLLVTQAWSVDAAPGDSDSTFVPTAGCRVADTRAAFAVGPRKAPLAPGETFTVNIHGENGECAGPLAIPTDAVAVALNVTATNATTNSNIRIFPADLADVPNLSNLNVTAGAPPTPNKVDVKLSPDGKINVYNFRGSVNIFIDVVGYYTNSTLQELSRRVVALETAQAAGVDPTVLARIDALETTTANNTSDVVANAWEIAVLDAGQPFAKSELDAGETVTATAEVVVAVTVIAPVSGQVTVNSATWVFESSAGSGVACSISSTATQDLNYIQQWESPGSSGSLSQMAGTRTFDIAEGATATYNLVCQNFGTSSSSSVNSSVLTAVFTPAP